MSFYIIGFIAGIMITLFCIFCIDAAVEFPDHRRGNGSLGGAFEKHEAGA